MASAAGIERAEAVLEFWFGDAARDPSALQQRVDLWFASSEETDARIAEHFGSLAAEAARSELEPWTAEPRACLALIILLDQFPRNLHRGSAEAFACDAHGLAVAEAGVAAGHLEVLATSEQCFYLLPYEHSENTEVHQRGLALFRRVLDRAAPEWRPSAKNSLDYALSHFEIIERFGRYPHRNAVMGRESTPEERAYLEAGAPSFGQG
jgi:uncharacterized protein (DUF924 family)